MKPTDPKHTPDLEMRTEQRYRADHSSVKVTVVQFVFEHTKDAEDFANAYSQNQETIRELVEALENVTASLENVLLHQGKYMTLSDLESRKGRIKEAQTAVKKAMGE